MTGDVSATKELLRVRILSTRAQLSGADRAAAGAGLATHGLAAWSGLGTVAAYLELGTEPPVAALLDGLLLAGVGVLLPVIESAGLTWAPYTGEDDLAPGPLGIRQPTAEPLGPGALTHADLVIVPALAVDHRGHRLGRGRGYYDRALSAADAPAVAVVYPEELLDEVPTEPHDVTVGAVLMPSGLVILG